MEITPEQLAASLEQRFRAELARDRELALQLQSRLLQVLRPLLRLKQGAWIIGSLANETWASGSDVDVVIENLAPEQRSIIWNALVDALHAHVDVLAFESLDEAFRERVINEGRRIDVT